VHDSIQPDFSRFLDRLTSRSVLSVEEQQAILNLPTHVLQVEANRDIVSVGERVDHACLVVAGLVGRFGQNSKGARQITSLYIPGDMPDLHSVVQPTATSALQALTTTTILKVPHAALREIGAQHPAIAEALWRDCMVDSMILAQWVVNVGRRNAKARIAHLLCEMACRSDPQHERTSVSYRLPMTQAHLADATGLTPVHVNRSLKALIPHGVRVQSGNVRIADWNELVAVANFDAGYLQADIKPQERIRILH
jgi:CRP-like cAMP-binding protein